MTVRGIVLAGGKGTRLGELTKVTNKHLLPVGPVPMVYHPLRKLAGAGIKDILLVSGTEHMGDFVELLGSGREHGCTLTYRVQDEAGGIAQALGLAELFCTGARCAVILGDNIFHDALGPMLADAAKKPDWAWVALKRVHDPARYGVAELQGDRIVITQGQPGGVLWFHPRLVEHTPYTTADIPLVSQAAVKAGVQEPSLAAAHHYVDGLRAQFAATTTTTTTTSTTSAAGKASTRTTTTVPPPITASTTP